jgi:acyl dehydratase
VLHLTGMETVWTPDVSASRRRTIDPAWLYDLCLWLQTPTTDPSPIVWPMLLIPEAVDRRFALPEDTLQVFHRVTWCTGLPSGELELSVRPAWVSARDGSYELGLVTTATAVGDTELLASSLMVVRTARPAEPWGERLLPRVPVVTEKERHRSLVIDRNQVDSFARLVGMKYPVHADVGYARQLGHPDVLVQGLLILLVEMHYLSPGQQGQIDVWFRGPVPVGSLVTVRSMGSDPVTSEFRLAGRDEPAAVSAVYRAPQS